MKRDILKIAWGNIHVLLLLMSVVAISPHLSLAQMPDRDFELGRTEANSGHFDRAREIWTKLSRQGHAQSQYSLGRLYANGDGVARNFSVAREWFQKAAYSGLADAQIALANTYLYGDGGSVDKQLAAKWLRLAAANGSAQAVKKLEELSESSLQLQPNRVIFSPQLRESPSSDYIRNERVSSPQSVSPAVVAPSGVPSGVLGQFDAQLVPSQHNGKETNVVGHGKPERRELKRLKAMYGEGLPAVTQITLFLYLTWIFTVIFLGATNKAVVFANWADFSLSLASLALVTIGTMGDSANTYFNWLAIVGGMGVWGLSVHMSILRNGFSMGFLVGMTKTPLALLAVLILVGAVFNSVRTRDSHGRTVPPNYFLALILASIFGGLTKALVNGHRIPLREKRQEEKKSGPKEEQSQSYQRAESSRERTSESEGREDYTRSKPEEKKPEPFDPYAVLAIKRPFTKAELRLRYITLIKQYHPDRVDDLGPEFKDLANRKMKDINRAYQELGAG